MTFDPKRSDWTGLYLSRMRAMKAEVERWQGKCAVLRHENNALRRAGTSFELNPKNPSHMHVPLEVKVWYRLGKLEPQLTLMVNTETVVRLTVDEARELAARLMWNAGHIVGQALRREGKDDPVKHLREADSVCPATLPGDITFRRDVTYAPDTMGMIYRPCELCYPENATL